MKITQEQIKKGEELMETLVKKAWESADFKEQLISNPKETIGKVTKVSSNLFDNTEFVVEDQTDSRIIYLNIPRKVETDSLELTEEQLEAVSGGIIITAATLAVIGIYIGCVAVGVAIYDATHPG